MGMIVKERGGEWRGRVWMDDYGKWWVEEGIDEDGWECFDDELKQWDWVWAGGMEEMGWEWKGRGGEGWDRWELVAMIRAPIWKPLQPSRQKSNTQGTHYSSVGSPCGGAIYYKSAWTRCPRANWSIAHTSTKHDLFSCHSFVSLEPTELNPIEGRILYGSCCLSENTLVCKCCFHEFWYAIKMRSNEWKSNRGQVLPFLVHLSAASRGIS